MKFHAYAAVFIGVDFFTRRPDHGRRLHTLDRGLFRFEVGAKRDRRRMRHESIRVGGFFGVGSCHPCPFLSVVIDLDQQIIDVLFGAIVIHQVESIAGRHGTAVSSAMRNGMVVLLLLDAEHGVILRLARPLDVSGIEIALDIAVDAGVAIHLALILQRIRVDLEVAVSVLVDVRLDDLIQIRRKNGVVGAIQAASGLMFVANGGLIRQRDQGRHIVHQHQRMLSSLMLEVVINPLHFHEAGDEVPRGLLILAAVFPGLVLFADSAGIVIGERILGEGIVDDLRNGLLLKDVTTSRKRQEPHPRHQVRRVVRQSSIVAQWSETAELAVEVAKRDAVNLPDSDGYVLAEHVLGRNRGVFRYQLQLEFE